jgi:hypothetical protein
MVCFDSIVNEDLRTISPIDGTHFSYDYAVHDISANVEELKYNLNWVKPHVLNALKGIPHSYFTPKEE